MSKMGNFVIDMRTDAVELGLDEFINKYGAHNKYVWDTVRYTWTDLEPDPEPDYYLGSDPEE